MYILSSKRRRTHSRPGTRKRCPECPRPAVAENRWTIHSSSLVSLKRSWRSRAHSAKCNCGSVLPINVVKSSNRRLRNARHNSSPTPLAPKLKTRWRRGRSRSSVSDRKTGHLLHQWPQQCRSLMRRCPIPAQLHRPACLLGWYPVPDDLDALIWWDGQAFHPATLHYRERPSS